MSKYNSHFHENTSTRLTAWNDHESDGKDDEIVQIDELPELQICHTDYWMYSDFSHRHNYMMIIYNLCFSF